MNWYIRKADKDSVKEYTVEDWEFTPARREDSLGMTEGFSPDLNFRKAFLPEPGHYWISRDFAGQEIRILANLAMEETWIKTIQSGGDIHTATAIQVWGAENYNSKSRKNAKAINFGIIYGSTAYGIADQLGITEDEAQAYIDKYYEKLPAIKRYLETCARDALRTKETQNIYGRKRRLKRYITPWGKMQNRGIRISYNFPIQSMGAEITKLALIKIYNTMILGKEFPEKDFYFKNTIHDEANGSCAYAIIKEVAFRLGEVMTHKMPGKPIPITTDLEIGHSMGLIWKFDQDKNTHELTPVFVEKY